jgi:CRISPR system Cascade subunit CasD
VVTAAGKVDLERTVVSPRFYLADAAFLVGLEGDEALLRALHQALRNPVWPLALGRKSFVPGVPIWLVDAISPLALKEALSSYPRLSDMHRAASSDPLRLVLENREEGSIRLDQPVAPFAQRRFGPRFVKTEVHPCT